MIKKFSDRYPRIPQVPEGLAEDIQAKLRDHATLWLEVDSRISGDAPDIGALSEAVQVQIEKNNDTHMFDIHIHYTDNPYYASLNRDIHRDLVDALARNTTGHVDFDIDFIDDKQACYSVRHLRDFITAFNDTVHKENEINPLLYPLPKERGR